MRAEEEVMGVNLLASGYDFAGLMENVAGFFTNLNALHIIEMLVFFFIIFFVSKVLRDNDATKLMWVYWSMIIVGGAMLL